MYSLVTCLHVSHSGDGIYMLICKHISSFSVQVMVLRSYRVVPAPWMNAQHLIGCGRSCAHLYVLRMAHLANHFYTYSLFYSIVVVINGLLHRF